jgi:membrane fusion protein (multidrug efflux system)
MNIKTAGFVSATLTAVLLSSCGDEKKGPQAAAPPPPSVVTYTVAKENVRGLDTYPGTIVPLTEVELRAEVNGYITGIFVKDGESVRKGQRLYEIDRSRYTQARQQAEAQLQIAKSNLQRVSKDVERYNRLAEQDAIAKQRVDYALADQQTAQSQVSAAEAALANANTDLARSVIVAPINGTLGIAQVRLGSLVTAGSTAINSISSPDPIAVDIPVGEQQLPRFIRLQQTATGKNDSTFTIQLPDGSIFKSSGRISAIDRAVDPQTGTIKVRVTFPNTGLALRAGMSCIVRVVNQDAGNLITVPNKALTEQLGEFFVYVLGDSNKVSQRRVVPGTRTDGKIVIRDGLKEGETIVSEGVQNLREGVKVNPGGAPGAQPAAGAK